MCVLDTTVADDEIVCFATNTTMWRYVVSTDTWSQMTRFTGVLSNGNTPVLDPKRKMIYTFGPNYDGSNQKLYSVSLSGAQTTDLTSSTKGCRDLLAYPYPSAVWDESIERIVGYVPITIAGGTTANNTIVIFDPATLTCTTQPQLGGSGPAAHSSTRAGQGTMGHFNYIPALGEYVLINNDSLDVYAFKLNANATHGLGLATLTCVDRDGDGYGTGPGCLGPDADDQDASVHTGAQFTSEVVNDSNLD